MPPDPLTAALDQLAAHHDRTTQLDAREAEHYVTVTGRLTELTDLAAGIGQTLRSHQEALVRLEDLDRQGTDVTAPPERDSDHYRPGPAPGLVAADRGRTSGAGCPAAVLGGARLPARLRAPGRHSWALLGIP